MSQNNPSREDDTTGLPPGAMLPEASAFKRDQLWAKLAVSGVALVFLLLATWLSHDYRWLYAGCSLVVLVVTAIGLVRYVIARRQTMPSP